MNKRGKSRAGLFLIELILAIAFFALGSSICVRAFTQAALTSRSAADLSFASSQVSSAASVIRYSSDPYTSAGKYFPHSRSDGNRLYIYYDQDRQLCSEKDSVYTMTVEIQENTGICSSHIQMSGPEDSNIYELDIRYPSVQEGENT